jgi:hypothetical protein
MRRSKAQASGCVIILTMTSASQDTGISGKKVIAGFSVGCLLFALFMAAGTYYFAEYMTPILKERFEREQQGQVKEPGPAQSNQ